MSILQQFSYQGAPVRAVLVGGCRGEIDEAEAAQLTPQVRHARHAYPIVPTV